MAGQNRLYTQVQVVVVNYHLAEVAAQDLETFEKIQYGIMDLAESCGLSWTFLTFEREEIPSREHVYPKRHDHYQVGGLPMVKDAIEKQRNSIEKFKTSVTKFLSEQVRKGLLLGFSIEISGEP